RTMGSQGSVLGASASTEYDAARGRTQRFVHGRMYHSAATGTHYLLGSIAALYVKNDGTGGPLGRPTTDTRNTADGKGQHIYSQHGAIYSHNGAGTHLIRGPIYAAWATTGR